MNAANGKNHGWKDSYFRMAYSTGGSGVIGLEIVHPMVSEGVHAVLFVRNFEKRNGTFHEMINAKQHPFQKMTAITIDSTDRKGANDDMDEAGRIG